MKHFFTIYLLMLIVGVSGQVLAQSGPNQPSAEKTTAVAIPDNLSVGQTANIIVTAIDVAGNPVVGATVTVKDETGKQVGTAPTTSTGLSFIPVTSNVPGTRTYTIQVGNTTINAKPSIVWKPVEFITDFKANPNPVCAGQRIQFTATLGLVSSSYSYTLANGSTILQTGTGTSTAFDQSVLASGLGNQNFTLTIISGVQTTKNTVEVTINPLPIVYEVTGTGPYCGGGTVGLSGSNTGLNYQLLRGGSTLGDPIVGTGNALSFTALSNSGTYTVQATNPSTGCSQTMSGSAIIGVNSNPTAPATQNTTYCQGVMASPLSATPVMNGTLTFYTVSSGGTQYTTLTPSTQKGANYYVSQTVNGCEGPRAQITVTINTLPTVSISPSMTAICAGQTATFSASGASAYQWRGPNGFTSSANLITVTAPGTYSVTGTNLQSCSAAATATLTVTPIPTTPSLKTPTNQPGQLYPEGKSNITLPQYSGTVTLIGGACPGGTIRWSGPNNTSGTGNITLPTNQTGTFVYQAICQMGQCTSPPTSATITVIKDKLRVVPPLFDCATNQLTLRTTGGNGKPVEYHIASITNGWSSANPLVVSSKDFRRDFDIDARQKESDNTGYDKAQELDDYELPRCGGARLATMEEIVEVPLSVKVLGNPVQGGELSVEIRGEQGQPLQLTLTDSQGRTVVEQQLPRAEALEHRRLGVSSQPAGMYLLQVSTPSQRQSVKVLKVD
ncbi:Ig-like domain-containing protein [Spirosoma pomorum]